MSARGRRPRGRRGQPPRASRIAGPCMPAHHQRSSTGTQQCPSPLGRTAARTSTSPRRASRQRRCIGRSGEPSGAGGGDGWERQPREPKARSPTATWPRPNTARSPGPQRNWATKEAFWSNDSPNSKPHAAGSSSSSSSCNAWSSPVVWRGAGGGVRGVPGSAAGATQTKLPARDRRHPTGSATKRGRRRQDRGLRCATVRRAPPRAGNAGRGSRAEDWKHFMTGLWNARAPNSGREMCRNRDFRVSEFPRNSQVELNNGVVSYSFDLS